ncbi:capsular polysaccharide export protein, LipB/KpsS family [Aliamphritea spongicola]|nr:hypothetical protein [Aliamphritea spongicola]
MQSYLYKYPEILDEYDLDYKEYENWKNTYLKNKFEQHVIGQARKINVGFYLKKVIQVVACYLERWFQLTSENSYTYKNIFDVKKVSHKFDELDPSCEYYFFPMQVSTDAQIILNYDKDSVIEALKEAINMASKDKVKLIVKPHPAEIDYKTLSELKEMHENKLFTLVNDNTFELIKGAKRVITVNSTVGLESMIVGTPVTFLGNSFYSSFDHDRLARYVMNYLIKIEYFSSNKISNNDVNHFFSRAK